MEREGLFPSFKEPITFVNGEQERLPSFSEDHGQNLVDPTVSTEVCLVREMQNSKFSSSTWFQQVALQASWLVGDWNRARMCVWRLHHHTRPRQCRRKNDWTLWTKYMQEVKTQASSKALGNRSLLLTVFYLCVFKPDKYHTKIAKVKSWTSSHKESFSPQRAWVDADEMSASPRNWVWDTRRNTINSDTSWNYPTPDYTATHLTTLTSRHPLADGDTRILYITGGSTPTFSFSLLLL